MALKPGTRGTLMVNTAVFPLPPSSVAPPGSDYNHSPGTLQGGDQLTFMSDVGVYQGHRFARVGIAPSPTGSRTMDTGAAPSSGFIVNDPGTVYWNAPAAPTLLHPTPAAPKVPPAPKAQPAKVPAASNRTAPAVAQRGSPMQQVRVPNASGQMITMNVNYVGTNQVDVYNPDGSVTSYFGDGSYRITMNGRVTHKGMDTKGNWTKFTGRPLRKRGSAAAPRPATYVPPPPPPPSPTRVWTVSTGPDGYPHAYRSNGTVDLGLYVGNAQTVKSTNGGRLWNLYDINPNATLHFVGTFGSVAGAPPPPNAVVNEVPAQLAPPPPIVVGPPPPPAYAVPPPAYFAGPTYLAAPPPPPPAYVVSPPTYPPSYSMPTVVTAPGVPGVVPDQPGAALVAWASTANGGQLAWNGAMWVANPAALAVPVAAAAAVPDPSSLTVAGVPPYDPTQAALYTGAAYGAEAALANMPQPAPAQQVDPLTASIMMGGGMSSDFTGDFSGMAGGFDPSTLAMLAGGDPDLATALALQNGGYDPTMGGLVDPTMGM